MNISEQFEKFTADFAAKVRASKGDTMATKHNLLGLKDARAEADRLEQELDTIRELFSEMIDIAKSHGNRVSLENSAYAELYKRLGMSEYRRGKETR